MCNMDIMTAIKRCPWEVSNPLVSLLLAGSLSHSYMYNTLWTKSRAKIKEMNSDQI